MCGELTTTTGRLLRKREAEYYNFKHSVYYSVISVLWYDKMTNTNFLLIFFILSYFLSF
jgi:hypothetical protein